MATFDCSISRTTFMPCVQCPNCSKLYAVQIEVHKCGRERCKNPPSAIYHDIATEEVNPLATTICSECQLRQIDSLKKEKKKCEKCDYLGYFDGEICASCTAPPATKKTRRELLKNAGVVVLTAPTNVTNKQTIVDDCKHFVLANDPFRIPTTFDFIEVQNGEIILHQVKTEDLNTFFENRTYVHINSAGVAHIPLRKIKNVSLSTHPI